MPSRAGKPNRNSQFLTNRLKEMYGKDFEPMIKAAENAIAMEGLAQQNDVDDDTKFSRHKECVTAWEKIGQYTNPKLKAIEVTGEDGGPVVTTVERVIVNAQN